ncbi:DUF3791 domain-containing protein [Treponema sp. TIM-1]|uniref:DUF3791 domain-containing protein n=1 Tax=Treponema sp. TIM-1 TaxID=2898417 RepID=UPI00397EA8E4
MTGIENRNASTWRDENLMIVYAVEGYARRHNITTRDAYTIFTKHGITADIRKHYGILHTQDPDETVYFCEDVLAWKQT